MSICPVVDFGLMRNVLTAVNCNTSSFARLGYESLTMSGSPFQNALTLLLTVYVAVTGYRLLFARGGVRMSDGPGIALKIGAILALVTSWSMFQTLVFDVAARAPLEIARSVSAPLRGDGSLAADPVRGLQTAYDQLSTAAAAFAKAKPSDTDLDAGAGATAAHALSLAANTLFVASIGLICVITVAIGVLTATGPLFIALFLFLETRGFFVGWVQALAGAAFALLSAWTLSILMLHAISPWLSGLSAQGSDLPDSQMAITTAVIVFVFAASQAGLLFAAIAIARGFQLHGALPGATAAAAANMRERDSAAAPIDLISRPARLAELMQQRDAPAQWISRAGATAAAARSQVPTIATTAAGPAADFYRRPAVDRSARGLA